MAARACHTGPGHVIPIDDHVMNLARFAVREYNKTHNSLEFKGAWTATVQRMDGGKRYGLTLEAADEDESSKYEAKVLVMPRGDKALEEFNPLLQCQA